MLLLISAELYGQDFGNWKSSRIRTARGIDSLIGQSKSVAMPIIAKHHFAQISGYHYPDIKDIFRIDNFNKWQHLTTLYIFVDSSDLVRKMNYFFSDKMPDYVADKLEDSMWWALPSRDPRELDPRMKDGFRMEDIAGRRDHGRLVMDTTWFGSIWGYEDHMNRLFWEQRKQRVTVIYSVAISEDSSLYNPRIGKNLPDDIYEPVLRRSD